MVIDKSEHCYIKPFISKYLRVQPEGYSDFCDPTGEE